MIGKNHAACHANKRRGDLILTVFLKWWGHSDNCHGGLTIEKAGEESKVVVPSRCQRLESADVFGVDIVCLFGDFIASIVIFSFADGDAHFALSVLMNSGKNSDVLIACTLAVSAKHCGADDPVTVDLALTSEYPFEIPKTLLKQVSEDYQFLTVEELKDLARHEIEKIDALRRRLKERLADPMKIDPSTSLFGRSARPHTPRVVL